MASPVHPQLGPSQQAVWNDKNAVVVTLAAYLGKLRNDFAYAAEFDWIEYCSYGLIQRIFGDLAMSCFATNLHTHLQCYPQGPFFDRNRRPGSTTPSQEQSIPEEERKKRIPDLLSVFTTTDSSGVYQESGLAFWVEVKALVGHWHHNSNPDKKTLFDFSFKFSESLNQVNEQAECAMKIYKGDVFYAFIVVTTRFSLLKYDRPTTAASDSETSEAAAPNLPVPGIAEVVLWNEPLFEGRELMFTKVFLTALSLVLFPLNLSIQPSWFDFDISEEDKISLDNLSPDSQERQEIGQAEVYTLHWKDVHNEDSEEDNTTTSLASNDSSYKGKAADRITSPVKTRASARIAENAAARADQLAAIVRRPSPKRPTKQTAVAAKAQDTAEGKKTAGGKQAATRGTVKEAVGGKRAAQGKQATGGKKAAGAKEGEASGSGSRSRAK